MCLSHHIHQTKPCQQPNLSCPGPNYRSMDPPPPDERRQGRTKWNSTKRGIGCGVVRRGCVQTPLAWWLYVINYKQKNAKLLMQPYSAGPPLRSWKFKGGTNAKLFTGACPQGAQENGATKRVASHRRLFFSLFQLRVFKKKRKKKC